MVRTGKNRNKNPESSKAPELSANDQLDHANINTINTINIPHILPLPNLEDLTPAERELQQRTLIMEGILRDVIHENTEL